MCSIELLEQRKHQPAMEERLRDMAMRLEKYLWEKSNGGGSSQRG